MKVILADMFRERFSFPEALAAVLTAETVCALVDGLMAFQPCACDKTLVTAGDLADVVALIGVCGLDMLFQVLVFNVVLVTAVV